MRKIHAILVLLLIGAQQLVLAQPYCIAPTNTETITPTGSTQTTGVYNSGAIAFPFAATAGCTYTFSTCGLSSTDTYLRLYDLNNQLVGADDNCGVQSNIVWLCPSSGTYYVFLSRFFCGNLDANTQMSYSVSCPVPPPADPTSITASTNNLCSNALAPVTLTVNGGVGTVYWFTGACATSGQIATGNSIVVNPSNTTTYFARNFDGLSFSTNCVSTTVNITSVPAITITGNTEICIDASTTLTASGGGSNSSLENVLTAINANSAALIASIPTPSGFNMDNGVNGNSIGDGCSDMYDGGNFINTNLQTQINYSDNAVIPSAAFGSGGQYFTRYLGPGGCQTGPATIFYMAADVDNITSLSITGNNGADGQGLQDLTTFTISANGITYDCFLKRVYNAFDPSINQIFMIPQPNSVTQSMGGSTDDCLHALSNLNGVTRVYYMLYAGASGAFIDNSQAASIAQTFANIIPTPINYTWSWSPGGETTDEITVTPPSNTTYTVTGTVGSCSNTASATVNLSSPPASPTVTVSLDPICAGGTTNLNATGTGVMTYYDAPTGGTLLGSTASGEDFPVSPLTTTTYYVEASPASPPGSQTFTFTGGTQTFVVPAGVTSIDVSMTGAAGGFGFPSASRGGYGGALTGTVAVTPGETLEIRVGGAGADGTESVPGAGGYNGGGTGALFSSSYSGGGGGGASDVRVSPYGDLDRIAVAGGGGGGAFNCGGVDPDRGGGGGGLTGQAGFACSTQGGTGAAGGGTQGAGGLAGSYPGWCDGTAGALGIGGNAGPCTNSGGGGGGGYFGGGGGAWAGGGGGSSFLAGATHTQDVNNGNGVVTISWTGSAGGCGSARTPITVNVNPLPTADAGAILDPICQNETSLPMGGSIGGSATNGTWSGGAGTWTNANDPANATYTADGSESGPISLTLTTSGGPCGVTSVSKLVVVIASPIAPNVTASFDEICVGNSTDLNATGVGQISWYDAPTAGNLLGTSASGADFNVSPTSTTTYYAETVSNSPAGSSTITYTGTIQQFVVPAGVTEITIETRGAQGGNGSFANGGLGAMMTGTFAVIPGQVLDILVGEQPINSNGGGGGTFVVNDSDNSPLLVAGGGGGGSGLCCGVPHEGAPGTIAIDGTAGINASGNTGAGGVGGNGGGAASDIQGSGAGGGFFTDGANGNNGSLGGQAYINGGAGALLNSPGGFGGGGGAHCGGPDCAGGGGGGYSGGGSTGGGSQWGGGGGGGSFNAGTDQNNMGGVQTGNGLVVITWSGSGNCPSPRTPITITVNQPSTQTDVVVAPAPYTWIDGNVYTTDNNTATFTVVGGGVNGCDLIITLDLTIVTSNGPENDFPCDAFYITSSGQTALNTYAFLADMTCNNSTGDNTTANPEPVGSACEGTISRSLWYSFTTPSCDVNGSVPFEIELSTNNPGTDFNTKVYLFSSPSNNCSSLTQLACNDDNNGAGYPALCGAGDATSSTIVATNLLPNTQYWVKVDGLNIADVGNFVLSGRAIAPAHTVNPAGNGTQIQLTTADMGAGLYTYYYKQVGSPGYSTFNSPSALTDTRTLAAGNSYQTQIMYRCGSNFDQSQWYRTAPQTTVLESVCALVNDMTCTFNGPNSYTLTWTQPSGELFTNNGALSGYRIKRNPVGSTGVFTFSNPAVVCVDGTCSVTLPGNSPTGFNWTIETRCSANTVQVGNTTSCGPAPEMTLGNDANNNTDKSMQHTFSFVNAEAGIEFVDVQMHDAYADFGLNTPMIGDYEMFVNSKNEITWRRVDASVDMNFDFIIVPNPSNAMTTVHLNTVVEAGTFTIVDAMGRTINSGAISNTDNVNIDAAQLQSGVYMVVVTVGNQQLTRRLVVAD